MNCVLYWTHPFNVAQILFLRPLLPVVSSEPVGTLAYTLFKTPDAYHIKESKE
jgi:hypothetical protein